MKAKSSHFDRLVARYYPAVYSFASRLTDDPREAIALTRNAFRSAQKQLCSLRDQTAVATILILAVIRAGLAAGKLQAAPHFTPEFLPRERAKLPVLALRGFYMSNWWKTFFRNVKRRIVEQVSELSVSRQRKWQLRQKQKGLCQKCSKPAVPESVYCVGHLVYQRIAARRRYQPKRGRMRQHRGTKSHRLAAAVQGDLRRLLPSDVQKLLASRHAEHRELARRALNERPELRPSARWVA